MKRLGLLKLGVFLGLAILGGGLFHTQILKGRLYRNLSENNRVRLIPLEAPRGRILDRAARPLATNRPSYNLVVTPEDIQPGVLAELARLLQISETEIRRRLAVPREYPFAPVALAEDIPSKLLFTLEELRPELPGMAIVTELIRAYPYGPVASHLVGYLGKINPREYEEGDRARYGLNSLVGRTGIEKVFDKKLRGWRGARHFEVNARGERIRTLSEKAPSPGEDLVLAIDLELQKRLSGLIEDKKATIAFLDLKTHELLAMASTPAFDPNVFVSPQGSEERLEFLKDKDAPLLDRARGAAYPPGSVFKLVTALAGLETGKITPHSTFHCPGYFKLNSKSRRFRCWQESGHGRLDLYRALERSCNVYFYNVGKLVGPDALARTARKLGLGETFQLELTNLAPGLVPDSVWKKKQFQEPWWPGDTVSYAVGQSYLLVSPLQILRLAAIIAKDGEWVEPKVVRDPGTPPSERKKVAIDEKHLNVIRQGMLKVVQSDYGTGQLARVDFDLLAAKTGTAQVPPKDPHAWITGFFPYRDPEVAFVIMVEHGGSGGVTAARLAKQALQIWNHWAHPG